MTTLLLLANFDHFVSVDFFGMVLQFTTEQTSVIRKSVTKLMYLNGLNHPLEGLLSHWPLRVKIEESPK